MIAAEHLDAGYGPCAVVRDVDLQIGSGELLAIVGPNGAGKSTLLKTLAGLIPALRGRVLVDGEELATLAPGARARRVAYVPAEDAAVPDLRVREIVAQGRLAHRPWWRSADDARDARAIDRAVALAQLDTALDRTIGTLSSGEAQRAWIGMAIAQESAALLLDEPTSHLDVRRGHETLVLLRRLAAEGHALAVVLHDLNLAAAYADRIAVIGERRLFALGTRDEVFVPEVLSAAYDADVRVLRDDDGLPVAIARPRAEE